MAAEHASFCHIARLVEVLVGPRSCKRLRLDLQAARAEKQPDLLVWSWLQLAIKGDTLSIWFVLAHYVLAGFEDFLGAERLFVLTGVLLLLPIRCHLCFIASIIYLC